MYLNVPMMKDLAIYTFGNEDKEKTIRNLKQIKTMTADKNIAYEIELLVNMFEFPEYTDKFYRTRYLAARCDITSMLTRIRLEKERSCAGCHKCCGKCSGRCKHCKCKEQGTNEFLKTLLVDWFCNSNRQQSIDNVSAAYEYVTDEAMKAVFEEVLDTLNSEQFAKQSLYEEYIAKCFRIVLSGLRIADSNMKAYEEYMAQVEDMI